MAESAQDTRSVLRMAGICKKCHRLKFGYLLDGRGPFVCYKCATGADTPPTSPPATKHYYFTSFTTTTSNTDTTSNWTNRKESGTS